MVSGELFGERMKDDQELRLLADEEGSPTHEAAVVYDGGCPFCCWYVEHLTDMNGLQKVDARLHVNVVRQLDRAHIDIDRDMALFDQGQLYKGAEALCRLARRQTNGHGVSRVLRQLFRWRPLASLFYPLLRLLRITYLKLSGRATVHAIHGVGVGPARGADNSETDNKS